MILTVGQLKRLFCESLTTELEKKIDELPSVTGEPAEFFGKSGADINNVIDIESIFLKPVIRMIFGFPKRSWLKLAVPTRVPVSELYPVQDYVYRDGLKKYVEHPPAQLPLVVKHVDGRLFAQDHTRIAAQIISGKTMIDVRLIEFTGYNHDPPYRRPVLREAVDVGEDIEYNVDPECETCPADGDDDPIEDVSVPDVKDWQSYIRWPVPLYHQASNFSCGAACAMAMFLYWIPDDYPYEYEADMWDDLGTTDDGTDPDDIVGFLNANGLEAENLTEKVDWDGVMELLEDGPVILCFQAWVDKKVADWQTTWDSGHYAILVGADDDNAFLMDPSTHGSYVWLPVKELKHRWHDYDKGWVPKSCFVISVAGPSEPVQVFPEMLRRLC